MTGADLVTRTDIAERAAILQYDNGMSRADAERQAVSEAYDRLMPSKPSGIPGEMAQAERTKSDPRLALIMAALKLDSPRFRAWGFQHIMVEGDTYRPAVAPEFGTAAVVAAATESGGLVDLVAATLDRPRVLLTRLGAAHVIGVDAIEHARSTGGALLIFSSLLQWIKGGGLGAIVIDWPHVRSALWGVQRLICHESLAPRLYAETRCRCPVPVRCCCPVPTITTIRSVSDVRYAA